GHAFDVELTILLSEANSDGTVNTSSASDFATFTTNRAPSPGPISKSVDTFELTGPQAFVLLLAGAPALEALAGNPDPWLSFQLSLENQHAGPLRWDNSINMVTDPIGLATLGGQVYHRAILDVQVIDLNADGEAWFRFPSWDVRADYFDIDFSTSPATIVDVEVPLPGEVGSGLLEVTPADGILRLVDVAGPFDLGGPLNAAGADEAENLLFLFGGAVSTGDRVEIAGYTCIAASSDDCGEFRALAVVPLPAAAWLMLPALMTLGAFRRPIVNRRAGETVRR
ncbi:MAG: hypothetical protein D6727_05800, partial [Gammaproteobacteria bacterium]